MDRSLFVGMLKDWGLALVIVVSVLLLWNLMQPGMNLDGEVAPDFALRDLAGQEHRLSEQAGKVVVINFWATWCGPCREEIPAFVRFAEEHPDMVVYGVNVEEPSARGAVQAASKRYKMNYPVLLDDRGLASSLYGVSMLPTTIIVGVDGTITHAKLGQLSLSRLESMAVQ